MKCLLAALALLSTPVLAQSVALPLRNLGAGTKLTFKQPLLIRANDSTAALPGGGALGCTLRMRRAEHFDRVIPSGTQLTVADAHEESVASRRMLLRHTTIEIDSGAVDSITCAPPSHSSAEPRVDDFASATRGLLALAPAAPVETR